MKIGLKRFSDLYLKSELIRSATLLISGTVGAQIISILLQPFIRRYFTPEVFGTFIVYQGLVSILLVLTSLRYDDAVVLPRRDKEAANVATLALIFNLVISSLIFTIFIIFGNRLMQFLNLPATFPATILYFIPLSVFLYNTFLIFNNWLIRKKRYRSITGNKLIRRASEGFFQVTFALTGQSKGLIYSDIIGQAANVTSTVFHSVKNGYNTGEVTLGKIRYVLKKYSDFPKYNLLPAIMSACSVYLPTLYITRFFSTDFTGYFEGSKFVLSVPAALIAASFSNVLIPVIAEKYQKKVSLFNDMTSILYLTIAIIVAETVLITFFGTELFTFIFGDKWVVSGQISKILVWSFSLNFFVSSFSFIYVAMRKIKIYSIWQSFYFFLIFSLFFFKNLSFTGFLKIYVLFEVLAYMILILNMGLILYNYESSVKNAKIIIKE